MIKTLCPYCGVGCGLEVIPTSQPDKPWQIRGDRAHPSSQGLVCVKGATVAEAMDKDRLLYPMFRNSLTESFQQITWEAAFNLIIDRLQTVLNTQGPDAICIYGSGQFQTEDYYIAQKLMKGCLGSNHFDANSRLCMSSAVSGYLQSFGSDGPPCCYDDLELTDCAFIVGANAAECHPIVFNRFEKYHKKNPQVKLIVVDPRCTPTAEKADLHLPITPGTDIDLFNGLAYLLMQWHKIDQAFIETYTNNFDNYRQVIESYPPEIVASKCNISPESIEAAARYWAESQKVLSLWSMGMNQSSEGTAKVRSLINLHLMTGQIGKPGMGPFSLTGQPNAMGGREAGGLSHLLPGYRFVKNPLHRQEIESFWGLKAGSISPEPGRDVWEMIRGLERGEIGFFWIAATNPAVSLPDLRRTQAAFKLSPFTVYQDAYYPTETSVYAHLLLPASQWGEKAGTMTNSERVVTLCQPVRQPPGEAKADWEIFAEVGRRLGFTKEFDFQSSADVFQEFAEVTRHRPCDLSGISHDRLKNEGPIQWPCPIDTKISQQRLYTNLKFNTPDGRAIFSAYHSRGLAEPIDSQYPFILTTGRLYGHWHTLTRTGRIAKIRQMHPNPFLEIHPEDADKLGLEPEQMVEVKSRRGSSRFPIKITSAIAKGTVFVPMHWGELWVKDAEANVLTHPESCPDSRQPELKACAVQIIPV